MAHDRNKSCIGCPSMMPSGQEQQNFFGKNMGTPMCARFGKPIGSIQSSERQRTEVAVALANTCGAHGEPRPSTVDWNKAQFAITLPDPEVLRFNQRRDQNLVRTCQSCEHFVREDVVGREFGFPVGLCSAKGKMVLPSRLTYEARDCDYRSLATNGVRTDVTGLTMLPEYAGDFTLSSDPVTYHRQQQAAGSVDPRDYETDKPVSDEDDAAGVRAWRKIEDPLTGNITHLAIFKPEFFTEEERKKIPQTGDDEHPEDYLDHGFFTYKVAVLWMELDETPAAWGQAGVGKTEFGRYMAWLMQIPFERISITGSSEIEDLAGKWTFVGGETKWVDGRIPIAWGKPCVLLVDEPNAGPPDVFQFMRPMMDNSKQLVLDQSDRHDMRDRNDYCFPIVAMNPAWDPKNVGTHVISDADANRMMHLSFLLPPPALEREILTKACDHDGYEIEGEMLATIMSIAEDIRNLAEEDALPITWGIRPQLKVARASRWFDLLTCYRMAVADFLDPQQQETLLNVVKSHVE